MSTKQRPTKHHSQSHTGNSPHTRPRKYFAACMRGLEPILEEELRSPAIGGPDLITEPSRSGVGFTAPQEVAMRAALWLRTATRLFEEINRTYITNPDALYDWCRYRINWPGLMHTEQTFKVDAAVHQVSSVTNSMFACMRVKDGLCDAFRAHFNKRPSVDLHNPSVRFYLYWNRGSAILYRDVVGGSLHRRGYRDVMHKSSLNETLAAAMVLMSRWDGITPLADPMCGAGTLAIEAALVALKRAPGLMRRERFHLERWPDTDLKQWQAVRKEAAARALTGEPGQIGTIMANDVHQGALSLARRDAAKAGVEHVIKFSSEDAEHWSPKTKPGLVLVNPPWGERLDHQPELAWQKLGVFLKRECPGATAMVLCGNREMTRNLRLKASGRHPVTVASMDCRILQYQIHENHPR